MDIKKIVDTFFDNWIRPIVFFVIVLVLFFVSISTVTSTSLNNIVFGFLLIGVAVMVFSIMNQLLKRNHLNSFLTLSILAVGFELMVVLFAFRAFVRIISVPTSNKLVIPKDANFNILLDSGKLDSISLLSIQEKNK